MKNQKGKVKNHLKKSQESCVKHRGMRRAKSDRGLVSVFLAAILSILLVMVLILTDLARISIAGGQMRTGLRLASNLALSTFDKELAKEYGLFALPDLERAQTIAEESFTRRLKKGEDHSDFFTITDGELALAPSEGARLSLPREMEKQVLSFMEWQSPGLLLEKINEETKIFKGLQDLPEVFDAKISYEKVLDEIQKEIDQCSVDFGKTKKADPSFLGGEKNNLFLGFPPLTESLNGLQEETKLLNQTLKRAYAYSINQNEEENFASFSDLFDPDIRELLEGRFQKVKKAYEERKEKLEEAINLAEALSHALDGMKEPEEKLTESKKNWENSLKNLPLGLVGISFQMESLAVGMEKSFLQYESLKNELKKVKQEGEKQIQLWEKVQLNGKALKDMQFSDWMKTIDEKYDQGEFLDSALSGEGEKASWEKESLLSPKGQSTEQNLVASSPSLRKSLKEFIVNMKKKGAAIIRAAKIQIKANRAEKAGLSHLTGSIRERISDDQMQRFEKDCQAENPPLIFLPGLADGSVEMMEEMIKSMKETGEYLQSADPAKSLSDHADLFLYWTHMFSCRISKKKEEEKKEPLLSLTSYPMNQRPYFGGELEYILYGQDQWMDNLKQASSRIFAMRLLANLAYAFSSKEIFAETHTAALALVGWTGFGVPLIQSALSFLLACGESWMDLHDLYLGKEVPVFKSEGSWRFALTGIHQVTKDLTRDFFDDLDAGLEGGIEEARDLAKEKVESIRKSSEEMVASALEKPIAQFILGELINGQGESRDQAAQTFDQMMARAQDQTGDGAVGKALKGAFQQIRKQKNELLDLLDQLQEEKRKGGVETEKLSQKAEEIAKEMAEKAEKPVLEKIDHLCDQGIDKAEAMLSKKEENLEKQMGEWFQGFRKEMGEEGMDMGLAVSSSLCMDYQDYIFLLLWIRSTGPQKATLLSNTARLIQAQSEGIDLTIAQTSLKWQGQARIQTTFLGNSPFPSLSGWAQPTYTIKENWEEGYEKYKKEDREESSAEP